MADSDKLLAEALKDAHQKGYQSGYEKGYAEAKLALGEKLNEELRELRDLLRRADAITSTLSDTSVFSATPAPNADNRQALTVDSSIEDFGLQARTRNVLIREGIRTIGQLTSKTSDQLLDYRVFGQGSLQEVRTALAKLGLYLAGEKPSAQLNEEDDYDPYIDR